MPNRELQDVNNVAIELLGARFRDPAGFRPRMQLGCEKRLVGIDVANAADECLVQQ